MKTLKILYLTLAFLTPTLIVSGQEEGKKKLEQEFEQYKKFREQDFEDFKRKRGV